MQATSCKKLAIDLDGVLTEHPRPLAHAAAGEFKMELPESAFVDSAGLNVPLPVRDWVYAEQGPAAALQPADGAISFLRRALDLFGDDNVMILTARPEQAEAMTRGWLRQHGFHNCQVRFADHKAAIALQHDCLYAVEDSLRHARNYAAAGVTCYLIAGESAGTRPPEDRIIEVADLPSLERRLVADHGATDQAPSTNPSASLTAVPVPDDRPRIVVSDAIHPAARARLAAQARLVDVDGTDVTALLRAVADADALVVRSETLVTAEVLAAAPRLRVVARAGVGVDNINLPAATAAGVVVLNAPGANSISAAEHTMALLLALTRQLVEANAGTRAGDWPRKRLTPIDLHGRTAGVVGLGRVGGLVAQRLRAFGMHVLAYDPYISTLRFTELGAAPVDYDTLLAKSDVVTFHVPHTPETAHMLDAARIARLKAAAIVLNVARGEVVDQDALAAALREGRIAGAGVDVFPHEPCTDSPLFGLPNAIVTPHTGGSSAEALAAVGDVISATTLAALRGEAVPNAVNMPASTLHAAELQRLTTVAGAAGHLLAVLQPEVPTALKVTVRGMVPGDIIEHVTGAALSEALQRWTDRRVTPVNARLMAQEAGLEVRVATVEAEADFLPQFAFESVGDPPHHVTVSWDRTNAGILEVDRFSLERPLAGDVLITHHRDQPGIIGHVGMILGQADVNIAGMQVGRHLHHRGGEAIMVLNVDDEIPETALRQIMELNGVETAYVVSLPPAEPRVVQASLLARLGA